ncbi:MAG TPA: hypothetical protein VFU13_22200 [Steroidobacteraceae bacterium]|nr:hypothetical protein [Steroidobacteraceae bacterium]
MPKKAKKLLTNKSVGVASQVSTLRLKRAGVTVKKMGLKRKTVAQSSRISDAMSRRLAGV